MAEDGEMFDVAVIGGGINGAGIAREAALRGASVLLLEKNDLASGTSSASTKLIHGGLRYLEHYEFGLVRESLKERETLWRLAPHLIQPMRLVLPVEGGRRPWWLLRAGLFLYDHLGGRKLLPATQSIRLERHPAGAALRHGGRAFLYSDGWCDDSRLVVLAARTAEARGAAILNYTPLTRALREDGAWSIEAGGRRFRARALVNAAGPGAAGVSRAIEGAPELPLLRLVRGSHIVVRRLFDHPFGYFLQLPDGRIIFALPFERDFTLIGTTDRDHEPGAPVVPSEEEIDYLLAAAAHWFREAPGRADLVHAFAGVRPLASDPSGKPEAASRGYRLLLSDAKEGAPLLTVLGGKLTAFRALGEKAVDMLERRLALPGAPGPAEDGGFSGHWLDELSARIAGAYPFLGQDAAMRLAKAYGEEAFAWLGTARSMADLGQDFGYGLTEAEVEWMMTKEYARTADDLLWRRSKFGLRLDEGQRERLEAYVAERAA